jgi:calcineurin-like phosphoesterase family protein
MEYFTSDSHFFHKKVIEYCNRPFRDVDEMNAYLVNAWNIVVTGDDEVVNFIGDFSFGTAEQTKEIFGQLKGRKRLIVGNHDKSHSKNWWRSIGFEEVVDSKIIQLGRFEVTLCHYPTGDPKRASYHAAFAQEKEAWLICGHVHEKWRVKGNVINVGVDAWGFCPVMDFQLTQIMEGWDVK